MGSPAHQPCSMRYIPRQYRQRYLAKTIDTHRENIKRKLALKNAAELNRQAVQFLLENS